MAARKKRKSSQSTGQFTPGQASYILGRILEDRRISKADVSRYLKEMQREIGTLEERLRSLRDAAGAWIAARRPGRPPRAAEERESSGTGSRKTRKKRSNITAEQRASRVLQGRYLGLIRQVPVSRRAGIKRIAKEKGREAAIREMTSILGR